MKHWIVLVLVGLLLMGVAPTYGKQALNQIELAPTSISTATMSANGDYAPPAVGPRRDPAGQDDIFYDQGNFNGALEFTYSSNGGLVGRVIFTAIVDFQLQAIKVAPWNGNNVQNITTNAWVYSQDANNNLTNRLLSKRFTVADGHDWTTIELAENEYIQFNAGDKFSIIYGPVPGGDPNGQGTGPCVQCDQSTTTHNSSLNITQNGLPPAAFNTWVAVDNDIYIRANGTLAHFIDLQVNNVFNGDPNQIPSGAFHMLPGTPQRFKAEIANLGDAINVALLDWYVFDGDSNQVFSYEQELDNIAAADTFVVQCDSVWTQNTPGRYYVQAKVTADNDANAANDAGYLDQFVVDPANHPDDWETYTSGAATSRDGSQNAGLAAVYYYPGGDVQYVLTGYRVTLSTDTVAIPVPVQIYKFTTASNSLSNLIADTIQTEAVAGAQVFEVNLEGDRQLMIGPGEAAFIVAFNTARSGIMKDGAPPSAGSNKFMPMAMWVTWNGGQGFNPSGTGDYMIDARFDVSDAPLPGPILRINPDPLNFGDSLSFSDNHTLEATFAAVGTDSIRVTNINIPLVVRRYFSVNQTVFTVQSQDTGRVTFTFHADTAITFDTQFQVSSNWQNHRNYILNVHASTVGGLSVKEGVQPGIPKEYAMSQNYPNPFNPTTTINFALPVPGNVALAVFDLNGRQVMGTKHANLGAGYHSFNFDASNLPAGLYTYRLTAGNFTSTKKMVLMK